MQSPLDQLIQQLEQVIQQLKVLETVFISIAVSKQHQSFDSWEEALGKAESRATRSSRSGNRFNQTDHR